MEQAEVVELGKLILEYEIEYKKVFLVDTKNRSELIWLRAFCIKKVT
jgi:hypothetical protein